MLWSVQDIAVTLPTSKSPVQLYYPGMRRKISDDLLHCAIISYSMTSSALHHSGSMLALMTFQAAMFIMYRVEVCTTVSGELAHQHTK
jgi:hypothetical protein